MQYIECQYEFNMFHVRTLNEYVRLMCRVNQQMHTGRICHFHYRVYISCI